LLSTLELLLLHQHSQQRLCGHLLTHTLLLLLLLLLPG
jgi:hypothetical protein